MEDHQIVDLYWARSENAIKESDKKYGRMLIGISLGLLGVFEDAEECVSDTYLAAWSRMPDERPAYLGAFLSKITRRISIDRYRAQNSKKRGGASSILDELSEAIPSGENIQSEYENSLLAGALNDFLLSIDEEKRYIFVRRYYYSDSTADIAKNIGSGEGKVKSILHRLRIALKNFLEKEGIEL